MSEPGSSTVESVSERREADVKAVAGATPTGVESKADPEVQGIIQSFDAIKAAVDEGDRGKVFKIALRLCVTHLLPVKILQWKQDEMLKAIKSLKDAAEAEQLITGEISNATKQLLTHTLAEFRQTFVTNELAGKHLMELMERTKRVVIRREIEKSLAKPSV